MKAKRGRPPLTGRFETREELCDAVWADYLGTNRKTGQIAAAYKITSSTVLNIIKNGEGKPSRS